MRLLAARAMSDVAAAQCATIVSLADSLHFFTTLRDRGPMTAGDVASACNVEPQFAHYALTALAASGYVDSDGTTYSLSDEQRAVFADEDSPLFLAGAFQLAKGLTTADAQQVAEGIARSSRVKFPPIVMQRAAGSLQNVAEIGCGSGGTLIELALRDPSLRATGIDRDAEAIARARDAAARAGVSDRIAFIVGDERALPPSNLILSLEMLHECPDPVSIARAVHAALQPGGRWLVVEPCGGASAGNDTRFLASLAALHCGPASRFAPNAPGPLALRETYERIVRDGGFTEFSVEADGPIHIVIEARR